MLPFDLGELSWLPWEVVNECLSAGCQFVWQGDRTEMMWWELAGWGLFGGFITDGLELWRLVRANGGSWPANCRSYGYLIAEVIRLGAGAGLALAFGASGQVSGPMGALAIGVATPLIVEKLSKSLPEVADPKEGGRK
jgi:hypothetical protein